MEERRFARAEWERGGEEGRKGRTRRESGKKGKKKEGKAADGWESRHDGCGWRLYRAFVTTRSLLFAIFVSRVELPTARCDFFSATTTAATATTTTIVLRARPTSTIGANFHRRILHRRSRESEIGWERERERERERGWEGGRGRASEQERAPCARRSKAVAVGSFSDEFPSA